MTARRLLLALAAVVVLPSIAVAQGPFGVGTPEPGGAAWAGPLAPIFDQIAAWQTEFYSQLTDALTALKADGGAFWVLAGVAFLYGIFHAAGPGHGKAVISAYLVASGDTLRRGIAISFAAAAVQGVSAVVLVSVFAIALNATSATMGEATRVLEIGSYALIALVGLWLLWTRIRPYRHGHHHHRHVEPVAAHDHRGESRRHDHVGHAGHGAPTASLGAAVAETHHHSHQVPEPAMVARPLTMRSAVAAIMAVGIRPCSGAVIVLVFALSQDLFAAGVASVFVMALGTAITVSALASLAVLARDAATSLLGGGRRLSLLVRGLEIAAAAAVLILGLLLLGGALAM